MDTTTFFEGHFDKLKNSDSGLDAIRQRAFLRFRERGIPAARNEEWKYTRIGSLFNADYSFSLTEGNISDADLSDIRLPGSEEANELIFINGIFSEKNSNIRSKELTVLPLEKAAKNEFSEIVRNHLGHSGKYQKDGINALNTAFVHGGVFMAVRKGKIASHPVYIYQISDSRSSNIFAQPRSLVHIGENAQVQIIETAHTLGKGESFTNGVMEVVVEKDSVLEYYQIQNDADHANLVSTTHIHQTGKSYIHAVTISTNGNIVRNNLNIVMDAEQAEAHLYGLYFLKGNTHVDNHTVVDNVMPKCYSNELYKGILNDNATGVFNGKIYVQPDAQKTNAYQSNKNILLSDGASVNTKPQLEIYADDVKCSHGCTVGRLNEEGLYYLQTRGISETKARSLLIHAFAIDILERIKPMDIRKYVDQIISERLEIDIE